MKLVDRLLLFIRAGIGVFDESSLTAAHGMLRGIFPGAVGAPPLRGTRELLESYSTMPWLRAAASKVASGVASCDWRLYVVRNGAGARARRVKAIQRAGEPRRKLLIEQHRESGELEEVADHPFLDLLDSANSFQTGLAMRKVTQLHLDMVGEAFWLKERNGAGMPTAVWSVPPNWILSTPTPTRRSFRVSYRGWQGEIPDTEFTWFADPDPANPYARGSGTARALADELETDEYAAKMTKHWFYNHARPDFMIWPEEPGTNLGEPELLRLQERWKQEHQGFWRVARPFFASRKIGIHEFDQGDHRSMQFVQLRQHERDTILQVLGGFPPEMLGIIEQSNRATIEAASFLFAKWVLTPRLEFLRAVMQERLVPEFDERLILDYVSPVEEDKLFALEAAKAAPYALKVDEWREMQGMDPLDGDQGQVHAVPFGITFQQEFGALPPPIDVSALPGRLPGAGEEGEQARRSRRLGSGNGRPDGGGAAWRRALLDDARAFAEAGDQEGERACLKALAGDPDDLPPLVRLASRLEPRLRVAFLEAVARVQAGVDLDRLAQALLAGQAGQIEVEAGLALLPGELAGLLPVLRQGFLAGAEFAHQGLAQAGLTMRFDLVNPNAVAWLERHGGDLIRGLSDEAFQAVREVVASAFREGRSVQETAREIRQLVGLLPRQVQAVSRFRRRLEEEGVAEAKLEVRVERYANAQLRHRATMISRTEILRSSSEGQLGLWREARVNGLLDPETTMRRWIVTRDDRLDLEICEPMDDEARGIVPLERPWRLPDGREVMVPQEAHPQCRCAAALEFK